MVKTTLSVVFVIITFVCMAQGMAGVECTIKNMEEESCKWYLYNMHDRKVEFLLKKTIYWCHGREATSNEFTRIEGPGTNYALCSSRDYCGYCNKYSTTIDISVISKNFVDSEPINNEGILDDFFNETGKPPASIPASNTSSDNKIKPAKPNEEGQINSPASTKGYNHYVYGTPGVFYGNYDKTKTADDVWKELEKSYWQELPEKRAAFEPYIEEMRVALENNQYGTFGELIEKALSSNNGSKPNAQNSTASPNGSIITTTTTTANYNTSNTSSNNNRQNQTGSPANNNLQNEGNYALFWIKPGLYKAAIHIVLNGNIVKQNKGKYPNAWKNIHDPRTSPPDCNEEEIMSEEWGDCCGKGFIKVQLTQTQNKWEAYEVSPGTSRKWSDSFTATPGCNIIEIK